MTIIAIDGPTGVGKSTTARHLAAELSAPLLLDPVSVDPLLDDYYTGEAAPAAALASELAFLRGRAALLASAPADRLVIADFTVTRTGPFSEFLADAADRTTVVAEMHEHLAAGPPVDALVLLTAEPEQLHERVRRRARDAEVELTVDHLVELRRHFDAWRPQLLAHAATTIEIDTADWDPHRRHDVDDLLDRLAPVLARRPA